MAGLSPDITLSSAPDVTASYLHMQMTRPLPRGPVVPRYWRAWLCAFLPVSVCQTGARQSNKKKFAVTTDVGGGMARKKKFRLEFDR